MKIGEGDVSVGISLAGHGFYCGQKACQWGTGADQDLRIRRRILILRSWSINDGSKFLAKVGIFCVFDDADDLVRSRSPIHAANPKSHRQRIFSEGELLDACLADDSDVGRAGAVVLVKVVAGQKGRLQRL